VFENAAESDMYRIGNMCAGATQRRLLGRDADVVYYGGVGAVCGENDGTYEVRDGYIDGSIWFGEATESFEDSLLCRGWFES